MRRREVPFVLTFGLALVPRFGRAQPRANLPRIGSLSFGTAPSGATPDPARGFALGLGELGYVEGQNILIERRFAGGQPDRLPALAAELVQLKVDIIVAGGPGPLQAARKATTTIPIVTIAGSDPVREGWAQSLAHPGGNVTGLTVTFPELASKYLELLKQTLGQVVRVAVLYAPADMPAAPAVLLELEAGARRLGLQLQVLPVKGPADIDAAFALARLQQAQAVYAVATNVVVTQREQIAALCASDKLPSISEFAQLARAGLLMTYGADLDDLGRRAIVYVDKILKGARPGDLAIERPTKFQLIVNLKSAKAIGIQLPQSLLLRADEVIR
ncbi:MAG: ABC transporter substrate-binding protein [Ideonella sp.]|nr:ABC transporter substrate-binding protein [Ideonella sp.]